MKKFIAIAALTLCAFAAFGQQRGTREYKIGDRGPGGGIVFLVEGEGGMEVSEDRRLGDDSVHDLSWTQAVEAAKNYRGGGKDDWRLPTKHELNLIYQNLIKAKIINWRSYHWSFSHSSAVSAWIQNFDDGAQHFGGFFGATMLPACAVRDF